MLKLLSEDCVLEDTSPAPDGTAYSGKTAITEFFENLFRESPQAHIEIEEIFSLGLHCIMRWKYEWVDAEGKQEHVRGADIFKLKDGLISEILSYVKG
jgi:predicted SnoaL-like aldol condensation-catalyzing enzyme